MKQAFNFWKHLNPGRVRQTEEIEEDESSSEEDTKKYTKYFPKEGRKRNNPLTQILLRSVPTFSGTGERFNRWVPKLETAMNSQPMGSGVKVNILVSKLTGMASDAYFVFQEAEPENANNYTKVREHLMDYFHGGETPESHMKTLKECKQRPGESIMAFATRLEQALNYAYPSTNGVSEGEQKLPFQSLKKRLLDGVEPELRSKLRDHPTPVNSFNE